MRINKLYICYSITTLLISVFVYSLIYSNIQNMKKLERLREEVDDIAQMMLQTPQQGKTEPKYLTELIDNFIKKRLAGIWDDLYSIKKQLKGRDCAASIAAAIKSSPKTDGTMAQVEERVNYASEDMGAKVIDVKAEPICRPNFLKSWLGMEFATNPPIYMLSKNMEPGRCFGFKNSKAEVIIQLANEVLIDQIAVQHITKSQSPLGDTSSAPKDFQVYGLQNNEESLLGSFKFVCHIPLQNFKVSTNQKFRKLKFQFESNHGHPEYTCVYRIAVYGKL